MANKPSEILKKAKTLVKEDYVYGYGYKGEVITKNNLEEHAKLYHYTKENKLLMQKKIGKKGIDCSGFVNKCAGTSLGNAASIKNAASVTYPVSDKTHIESGMFIWKNGHIGLITIEFGKIKIREARSTSRDLTVSDWNDRAKDFTCYGKIKGVVYPSDKKKKASSYTQDKFIRDIKKSFGLKEKASIEEVFEKTITISENKNRYHSAVTALEKRLKALKLYSGEIEVVKDKTPIFGPKMAEAIKKYEKKYVYPKQKTKGNSVLEAKSKTWKKLLGMEK